MRGDRSSLQNAAMLRTGRKSRAGPAVAAVSAPFGRDVDAGLDQIERIVSRARARGAELVVLPEAALGGYLFEPVLPGARTSVAPPPQLRRDGPEIERLARIAGDTVVCAGYTEAAPGGRYSSAVCVTRRRRARPPAQGAPAARGEGAVPLGRRLRGLRHAGRPDGDARLLRQGLPRGGPRAVAGRRRHRRLAWPRGRCAGRARPRAPSATARWSTSTCSTAPAPWRTR